MPIFEYTCDACGHAFEKLVMAPASERTACAKCDSRKITRRFSTFSALSGSESRRDPGMAPCADRGGPPAGGCRGPGSCGCA